MTTPEPTAEELTYAARDAWRLNALCIGRAGWKSLDVVDARTASTADAVHAAATRHLIASYNAGAILPTLTVLPWYARIVNRQLCGFAADPANADLAARAVALGWSALAGERHALLPLMVDLPGEPTAIFPAPDSVPLVRLGGPIADLGLCWYPVPVISRYQLVLPDGRRWPVLFSGHYVDAEVWWDLMDPSRYNVGPAVRHTLGLAGAPQRVARRATGDALEDAIRVSFPAAGVKLVDHYAVADQYEAHCQRERGAGRDVPEYWPWMGSWRDAAAKPQWDRYSQVEHLPGPALVPYDKPPGWLPGPSMTAKN